MWQPNAGTTNMAAAWLGSVRTLVLGEFVTVGAPDRLASPSWAMDYNEVKAYGRATGSARSQAMTDIAQFFNSNAATMVSDALVRYLQAHPLSLRRTALLFAQVHGAMTDSAIACWWLKREVGFWRPYEAISGHPVVGHFDDGNPDTAPEPGWTPLVNPNPNYSDYVSGHACVTSPATEVIRRTLGEETRLELRSQFSATPAPPAPTTTCSRNRARRVQRPHLVRAALPPCHGRRLRDRAPHRREGDGRSRLISVGSPYTTHVLDRSTGG